MASRRGMPLLGSLDTWGLLGLSGGAIAASPWLAGYWPGAIAAGAVAGAAGAALAYPRLRRRLDPVDDDQYEDFILRSDPLMECAPEDGPLVGYTTDTNRPLRIPYNLLTRHMALVGASGVGKTTLGMSLIWQQIVRGGGLTFIDAKIDSDSLAAMIHMAKVTGRESDLRILDISNPGLSHSYNPVMEGDADEVSSRLLNLIPAAENNPGADHYRQSVNHALTAITGGLKAAKLLYHFGDLTILMQSPGALDAILRMIPPGPERMALDVFLDKYRKPASKDSPEAVVDVAKLKDTLGGMSGRLALFAQGKFGRILNTYTPEVDLFDVVTNNRILYVRLPTMAKETAALNFAKMLLSDFRSATARVQSLTRARRPWPPHLLFADEMGSYVMPGMARFFEQARSANITVIPGFQAFGNLREVSPEFADIVLQNTWSKTMFRFGGADSAEMAAEIIGKRRRMTYSLSTSENTSQSSPFVHAAPQSSTGTGGGTGESWRENEEYRVSPGRLSSLGIGTCVTLVGSRLYHLRVPMIAPPMANEDVYAPLRHPVRHPSGWTPLDLEHRYAEFMSV